MLGKHFHQIFSNNKLRISMTELSRVTGVSTSQLRYWERKGYIKSNQDDKNKNHYFSLLTMIKVLNIKEFLDQGYTLSVALANTNQRRQIGKIFQSFIADRVLDIKQLSPDKGEVDLGPLADDPTKSVYAVVEKDGTRLYCRPTEKPKD